MSKSSYSSMLVQNLQQAETIRIQETEIRGYQDQVEMLHRQLQVANTTIPVVDLEYLSDMIGELAAWAASGDMPIIVANWIVRSLAKRYDSTTAFGDKAVYELVLLATDLCLAMRVEREIFGNPVLAGAHHHQWVARPRTQPNKMFFDLTYDYIVCRHIPIVSPKPEIYAIDRSQSLVESGDAITLQPWTREKLKEHSLRLTLGLPT